MASPELYSNNFGEWLEANGVEFTGFDERPIAVPFKATVDLNSLKVGVMELLASPEFWDE